MVSTIATIRQTLGREDLLYRYLGADDGLLGREGAFLAFSFWLVASLALAGDVAEGHAIFRRLLHHADHLTNVPWNRPISAPSQPFAKPSASK